MEKRKKGQVLPKKHKNKQDLRILPILRLKIIYGKVPVPFWKMELYKDYNNKWLQ